MVIFGLGPAGRPLRLLVRWPARGRKTIIRDGSALWLASNKLGPLDSVLTLEPPPLSA